MPLEEIQDRFEIRVKYSLLDNAPRNLGGFEIEALLTELLKNYKMKHRCRLKIWYYFKSVFL